MQKQILNNSQDRIDQILADLENCIDQGGILDYKVVCDETNNSQEDMDERRLTVSLYLKRPTQIEINFIIEKDGNIIFY